MRYSFMLILLFSVSIQAQTGAVPVSVKATDLDYRKDGNGYLLVLKRGQPLIASLNAFMEKEKLAGASISGIGAVQNAELAYYDIAQKKYTYTKFDGSMEVLSLQGNLGFFDNKPIVHAHMSLGAPDFTVHGGHVKEATVSLILEIFITPTTKPVTREWNKDFPELRTMKTLREE